MEVRSVYALLRAYALTNLARFQYQLMCFYQVWSRYINFYEQKSVYSTHPQTVGHDLIDTEFRTDEELLHFIESFGVLYLLWWVQKLDKKWNI